MPSNRTCAGCGAPSELRRHTCSYCGRRCAYEAPYSGVWRLEPGEHIDVTTIDSPHRMTIPMDPQPLPMVRIRK